MVLASSALLVVLLVRCGLIFASSQSSFTNQAWRRATSTVYTMTQVAYILSPDLIIFFLHPSPLLCLLGLLSFQPHACFDLREVPRDQPLVSHDVLPGPPKLRPSKVK